MAFDPTQSPIQRDPKQLAHFVAALEDTLQGVCAVVGIVEIGSFAKGEAIPTSDTDTRAYIKSADVLCANFAADSAPPPGFREFLTTGPAAQQRFFPYVPFNAELRQRLSGKVDNKISCGFVDIGHAQFLFDRLDRFPTQDHSMLLQSTIAYDPSGWIAQRRAELDGRVQPSLIELYRDQVLHRVQRQLPQFAANPDHRRGPHQWLLKAVRCVREVISLQSYAQTGRFLFRKEEVLKAVCHSPRADLIEQLYAWKCNGAIRREIIQSHEAGDNQWPRRFEALTPQVQAWVAEQLESIPIDPKSRGTAP